MTTVAYLDESASTWDRTLYAFLAEKHRRSGSRRTVDAYSRMLNDFFGRAGMTPQPGHQRRRLRLGLRARPLRQGTVVGHHRRPAGLPQQLL